MFHLFCRTCRERRQAVKEYESRQAKKRQGRLVFLGEMIASRSEAREMLDRLVTPDPFSLPSATQFSAQSSPPIPGPSTKRSPSWIARVRGIRSP